MAAFLGLFTLLNLAGNHVFPGFDATIWWLDVRLLSAPFRPLFLAISAAGLLATASGLPPNRVIRGFSEFTVLALLAIALNNSAIFYILWTHGAMHPGVPIPLSLFLAAALAMILYSVRIPYRRKTLLHGALFAATLAGCAVIFPLAQMYCFGETDYSRRADAIVVFGALTYKDGTPSQALADRVNTAIALYNRGLAPTLIFSGGPSHGPISEPEAMRTLALSQGVPDSAILLDEAGVHTDASVRRTAAMFRSRDYYTALAVSHAYHLPRIKMAYSRELGDGPIQVLTVPARESAPLVRMPVYMLREVAAFWAYYFRPLLARPHP